MDRKKTGVVFVGRTVAYTTLPPHFRGSTFIAARTHDLNNNGPCPQPQHYPDHRLFIVQLLGSEELRSSEIVPGRLLFKIYEHNPPSTIFRKFAYTNDLEIVHSKAYWQEVEEVLNQDMVTLSTYFQKFKLKLSATTRCQQPSTLIT